MARMHAARALVGVVSWCLGYVAAANALPEPDALFRTHVSMDGASLPRSIEVRAEPEAKSFAAVGFGPSGDATIRYATERSVPTATPTKTPTVAVSPPPPPTLTRTPTSCPTGCTRLGYLSVSGPIEVVPSRPTVGEEVTIGFRASYALPQGVGCGPFDSCRLEGGEAYLEGDAAPAYEFATDEIVFRRRVVAAGVATIRIQVTATTEDQCYYSDPVFGCGSYFQSTGIEAFSKPFDIELFESGATPTATPTDSHSPTPTCTARCDDLCGVDEWCCIENPKCGTNEACVPDGTWYGCCQCATHTPGSDVTRSPTPSRCAGDCNDDETVTVDELIRGVNLALGLLPVPHCPAFDLDGTGEISVNELIVAVNAALVGCAGAATPTATPTATRSPDATSTAGPGLDLQVSWPAVVEPPQTAFAIRIAMSDDEANYSDWVVGDVAGSLASGRLGRGEATSVSFEVDWTALPLLNSNRLFYVYARGDNGSTFAQVVHVDFEKPVTEATPTPTLSCGYAGFAVKTEPKLTVCYPDSSFTVEIANEGILQCGDLDWQAIEPASQADALSCVPDHGELEGALSSGEPTIENIECAIDWSGIPAGQEEEYYLVLFSYPRVNGIDSAQLVEVHLEKPAGADP